LHRKSNTNYFKKIRTTNNFKNLYKSSPKKIGSSQTVLSNKLNSLYKFQNKDPNLKHHNTIYPKSKAQYTFNVAINKLKFSNALNKVLLTHSSLFIKFRVIIINFIFKTEKFLIRKKIYSFLKTNEAKKSIMNRRKRISTSRFYKRLIKSTLLVQPSINSKRLSNFMLERKSFQSHLSKSSMSQLNFSSRDSTELFLPRVKFKPCYQRI
jgi:hypothetical protein